MKKNNQLLQIQAAYRQYIQNKKPVDQTIIENHKWFKQQQTEYDNSHDKAAQQQQTPAARSGYIFSAINVKHADAMDNYPEINILPREAADIDEAKALTSILPCVLEMCNFKSVYSACWWQKLKAGTGVYGVFWNPSLQNGLGDIEIKKVSLLNLAWEPGVNNIQDSKYLFYSYYMDKDEFVKKYGKAKLDTAESLVNDLQTHEELPLEQKTQKVLVVDCYYKQDKKVYLIKYSGNNILEQSKDGVYDHGLYPFVFDVMYPNEDAPNGFGIVDVVKGPQAYIDKLDALISENAVVTGKKRWFIRDNGGVNEDEFLDVENPLIHVEGSLDEYNLKEIPDSAMPGYIIEHRLNKITELKEVIGNRDFQQGGTSNGVTAASAITVLQQAGDKLVRDMTSESYEAYKQIIFMCIELVRQFYDIERKFRITGQDGQPQYATYNNSGIKPQRVESVLDGEGAILRKPEFDISLTVQKANPFNKAQQNNTILQLWNAGMFNPNMIDASCIALEFMQFDGKDEIMTRLREVSQQQQQLAQLQQQQQQQQQLAQLQQQQQLPTTTNY